MNEFVIRRDFRESFLPEHGKLSKSSKIIFNDLIDARIVLQSITDSKIAQSQLRAEDLYAMSLIYEVLHVIIDKHFHSLAEDSKIVFDGKIQNILRDESSRKILDEFSYHFPSSVTYKLQLDHARQRIDEVPSTENLRILLVLHLINKNPGFVFIKDMIDDEVLSQSYSYTRLLNTIRQYLLSSEGEKGTHDMYDMLMKPAQHFPNSLQDQMVYISKHWAYMTEDLLPRILRGIDYLREVNKFENQVQGQFIKGHIPPLTYHTERGAHDSQKIGFSRDSDWMPKVVLLAKTTLVWLDQLSKNYKKEINRLDQIPNSELDLISSRGFNALWLIGLWERSTASQIIKNRCGNPDAAASAYALYSNDIAQNIGGWEALNQFRERCLQRGIRLASDMVPNHTGIDSIWVYEHPDWFLSLEHPPYPDYSFNSENLSSNPDFGIYLEDHYYDKSDAAVVFKRINFKSGAVRYIYHGNDGTSTPWNDTAQLNYLNPELREAVIQTILHVARKFPIIRFDAAMTLARKHIHRLWFPAPGSGGDIPSRSEYGMIWDDFIHNLPREFWRDVVDRMQKEAPDTLLLAEAFWMMEGYFVRDLGMHRVYNSAFMNMLRDEDNAGYRQTIKNTIATDPQILQRFVNFMNNPDEETAIAQFGDGDKYFGICTLMVTMPGLPMFGHGQIEGFTERYGMEYRRAYLDEQVRENFIQRHEREIFPLMKKRHIFSNAKNFFLYDFYTDDGVNENVFAYTNGTKFEYSFVIYNNSYKRTSGLLSPEFAHTLGCASGKNYYYLSYEIRSGLWYFWSCADCFRQGLQFHLQGYEAQVYINLHEVKDKNGVCRHFYEHAIGITMSELESAGIV